MMLRHIGKYYPHMGKYVKDGYQGLRENELVAENEQLHELSEQLEADVDPDSMAPSYNFRRLLDTLAHRGKAELTNHRCGTHDWKAMTWANSQHSPECGSWLRGRSNDFYPFPNSHTYYINALRGGTTFLLPLQCQDKHPIRPMAVPTRIQ
jgi:hypothetical protein